MPAPAARHRPIHTSKWHIRKLDGRWTVCPPLAVEFSFSIIACDSWRQAISIALDQIEYHQFLYHGRRFA
jgi:hypothetical protein